MSSQRGRRSRPSRGRAAPRQPAAPTPRTEKQERRLQRQQAEAAARRAAARRQRLRRGALVVVGVVVVGLGGFLVLRPDPEISGVERPPNLGRGHVAEPSFESDTPTSGPHLAQAPRCGVFLQPLDLGLAVHGLEHGAVVVWYRSDLADEVRADLGDLAGEWDSHVIVAPGPETLAAPIVATAWNRLDRYPTPGPDLRRFIDTYRRRGPERVGCDT